MSLLIRGSRFNSPRWYIDTLNTFREHILPVSASRFFYQFPSVSRKSFSLYASLSSPDVQVQKYFDYLMNVNKTQDWSKDNLAKIIDIHKTSDLLNERMHLVENINSLKDLITDDVEMTKLMNAEELLYKTKLEEVDEKLMQRILENLGKETYKSIVLIISAGVGGQEAMLFVKDLYNMYIGYLEYLGLDYEVMELDKSDHGGIRTANIIISGDNALLKLKYEGGVHRVQRVPATEKSGRIHTSTASVAILPEPTDIEIDLDEKDLKVETKRASGPGGQHVNTTDSAVRVTHIPSGISVNCQIGRTQHKNKEWAITKLKSILYEQELNKQTSFLGSLRKKQMGLGMRNEKIRTYNYVQDRITDHRLENGTIHNLPTFMMGGTALEQLEDRLHKDMQKKILMDILKMSEMQLK